jgi:putative transposase
MAIVARFQCLQPQVTATTGRPLSRIARAMGAMTGRGTRLGCARWAGTGGSSRTVQRFFATGIPWATLFWGFFRSQISCSEEVSRLVGDAGVVTKAGKRTQGLERFFASLDGKPGPGGAFLPLALVRGQARRSFPRRVEPVVRSAAEQAASKAKAAAKKPKARGAQRRPGRPKGSKNHPTADGTVTPEFGRIPGWLAALLHLIAGVISWTYLGLDGHFGTHNAVQMARQTNLQLISTLRWDAALSFPYSGPYAGRGPQRHYGHQSDSNNIPVQSLKETTGEGHIQPRLYQGQLLHKEVAPPLNVVIMVKGNRQTQAHAHVILFSSALPLAAAALVDSYGLRCQIEIV